MSHLLLQIYILCIKADNNFNGVVFPHIVLTNVFNVTSIILNVVCFDLVILFFFGFINESLNKPLKV